MVLVRKKKDYVMVIHPAVLGSPALCELTGLLHLEPGRAVYSFDPGEQSRILASFDRSVLRTANGARATLASAGPAHARHGIPGPAAGRRLPRNSPPPFAPTSASRAGRSTR